MKTRVLAFYNLGVEMEHLKDFDEATTMYKKAITAMDKANKKYLNRFDIDVPPLIDPVLLLNIKGALYAISDKREQISGFMKQRQEM